MKTKFALLAAILFLTSATPANADVREVKETTYGCKNFNESFKSKQYVNSDGTVEVLLTYNGRFSRARFDSFTIPAKLNGTSFKAFSIHNSNPMEIYACLTEDSKAVSVGFVNYTSMSKEEYDRSEALDRREEKIDRWYDRRERREDRREQYRY